MDYSIKRWIMDFFRECSQPKKHGHTIPILHLNEEDEEEHHHVKEQEDLRIEIFDMSHNK